MNVTGRLFVWICLLMMDRHSVQTVLVFEHFHTSFNIDIEHCLIGTIRLKICNNRASAWRFNCLGLCFNLWFKMISVTRAFFEIFGSKSLVKLWTRLQWLLNPHLLTEIMNTETYITGKKNKARSESLRFERDYSSTSFFLKQQYTL